MWGLQSLHNAGLCYWLPVARELVVGRKGCDVLLPGDQSISRRHALLQLEEGGASEHGVWLTDCKSTFGTTVNGCKLQANHKHSLQKDDLVKFGQAPNTGNFKLVHEVLTFCCSTMTTADKAAVKQLAKSLGGRVVNSWRSDCTHLVMNTLTVTIKVVSALAACRPVVTSRWLEEAVKARREGRVLPQTSAYLPTIVDENADVGVESFAPDFRRAKLFQNRVFYFISEKQHSRLQHCVELGGARCVLAAAGGSLQRLLAHDSVVVFVDDDVMARLSAPERKWAGQVHDFLESNGVRAVMDSEIGLALLHVSIETHCNPRRVGSCSSIPLPAPSLSQLDSQFMSQFPDPGSSIGSHSNVTVLAANTEPSQMSARGACPEESSDNAGNILMKAHVISETLSQVEAAAAAAVGDPSQSARLTAAVHSAVGDPQPDEDSCCNAAIVPGLQQSQAQCGTEEEEPSVLAPCSLTPLSQEHSSRLPSSGVIGKLFKGKRRLESGDAGACAASQSPPRVAALDTSNGCSTFIQSQPVDSSTCKLIPISQDSLNGKPTPQLPKGNVNMKTVDCIEDTRAHSETVMPSVSTAPPPFLSARERRSSKAQANDSVLLDSSPSIFAQNNGVPCTQSGVLINPFNSLLLASRSTESSSNTATCTGVRSKATMLPPRILDNDDIWREEEGEREEPLAVKNEPESTARAYKPCLTDDGFILPRDKPKLLTSRFGRLALLSREVGGAHLAEGGEAHLQHKVDIKVNVSVVSLESRGGGRGRLVEGAGRDQINPTVVDFKQFKKFDQGSAGLPRIIEVAEYVPATSNKLQDWSVNEEGPSGGDREEEEEEEEEERFHFVLPPAKRKKVVL